MPYKVASSALLAAIASMTMLSPAHAQNLLQVYEAAHGYDAIFAASKADAEATLARADQTKSLVLPQVGFGASVQRTDTSTRNPVSDSESKQKGAGIKASMPLFNLANLKTREKARKVPDLAVIQVKAAEQDLMVRTADAYFAVLAAQDNLRLARTQSSAVAEQLQFAKRNFEVGTATITDSREAQARYDLATAQTSAAEFDLQIKLNALMQLVGKDNLQPWPLAQPFTPPALEDGRAQYWLDLAQNSDTVRAKRIQYEMAKLDTEAARAGHYPTVNASLGYDAGRSSPNTLAPSGDLRSRRTSAAINLDIPIFAGFAIQNQVKEKLALEDKARSEKDSAERDLAQGTRQAYFGSQSLEAQIRALEAAEKSSLSSLEANKLGYEVGVRINVDVLNAQAQLFDTQSKLAKARYDLLVTQLRLKQAVGTLTLNDLQRVNQYLVAPGQVAEDNAGTKVNPPKAVAPKAAAPKAPTPKASAVATPSNSATATATATALPTATLKTKATAKPSPKASKKAQPVPTPSASPTASPSPTATKAGV